MTKHQEEATTYHVILTTRDGREYPRIVAAAETDDSAGDALTVTTREAEIVNLLATGTDVTGCFPGHAWRGWCGDWQNADGRVYRLHVDEKTGELWACALLVKYDLGDEIRPHSEHIWTGEEWLAETRDEAAIIADIHADIREDIREWLAEIRDDLKAWRPSTRALEAAVEASVAEGEFVVELGDDIWEAEQEYKH